ncbi:hypothetical protein CVT24_007886 [Panaeolus cyanescens]|uniref:Reverse transcriptase domain-containing protein n=1 Tax=Panaeolus cyanescens TaxID=181874 RepID=A0A409YQK1_9AGAR|nr:hypothetical protein CVT24_007886 [Panaeolus cyanescens]
MHDIPPGDLLVLDELPAPPKQEWEPFSTMELREALDAWSGLSAPGPDHITWRYLKRVIDANGVEDLLVSLANSLP